MNDARHRDAVCPRIAYMPQGLGKNLYFELSVFENIDFFARLFGVLRRRAPLADHGACSTPPGSGPFPDRPAGKLSGGMKQKVGLCVVVDSRPRPAHPRRADDRRRSALPSAVLDARSTTSAPGGPA